MVKENDLLATGQWLDELAEKHPERARAIARTEIIERLHMSSDQEILPAMTLEEAEAFIDAEDEMIKESREPTSETYLDARNLKEIDVEGITWLEKKD